jgi:hypothetical protein
MPGDAQGPGVVLITLPWPNICLTLVVSVLSVCALTAFLEATLLKNLLYTRVEGGGRGKGIMVLRLPAHWALHPCSGIQQCDP